MSIIGKYIKENGRVTVREILLHVEEELEIGWANDTLKTESSKIEELSRERAVLYAKMMETKEGMKSITSTFEKQADEAVRAITGKKSSTIAERQAWVEEQADDNLDYVQLSDKVDEYVMDIAGVDLKKTLLDTEVKRAKYNFRMYEALTSAMKLMVEHKETVIN